MSSDIEIVIKSETGAIEEELELELDEGHTIKDILDYLVQMNLLKVPHNDVTLYKDGKIVSPNLELKDIYNRRAGTRMQLNLEQNSKIGKSGSVHKQSQPIPFQDKDDLMGQSHMDLLVPNPVPIPHVEMKEPVFQQKRPPPPPMGMPDSPGMFSIPSGGTKDSDFFVNPPPQTKAPVVTPPSGFGAFSPPPTPSPVITPPVYGAFSSPAAQKVVAPTPVPPPPTYNNPYSNPYSNPPPGNSVSKPQPIPQRVQTVPSQNVSSDIEVKVIVDDIVKGLFDVTVGASQHQSFVDIKEKVMNAINSSQLASDQWGRDEEIKIYWREKLVSLFHKADRAFSEIPGIIKDGRVTFKIEKVYPGGASSH